MRVDNRVGGAAWVMGSAYLTKCGPVGVVIRASLNDEIIQASFRAGLPADEGVGPLTGCSEADEHKGKWIRSVAKRPIAEIGDSALLHEPGGSISHVRADLGPGNAIRAFPQDQRTCIVSVQLGIKVIQTEDSMQVQVVAGLDEKGPLDPMKAGAQKIGHRR